MPGWVACSLFLSPRWKDEREQTWTPSTRRPVSAPCAHEARQTIAQTIAATKRVQKGCRRELLAIQQPFQLGRVPTLKLQLHPHSSPGGPMHSVHGEHPSLQSNSCGREDAAATCSRVAPTPSTGDIRTDAYAQTRSSVIRNGVDGNRDNRTARTANSASTNNSKW